MKIRNMKRIWKFSIISGLCLALGLSSVISDSVEAIPRDRADQEDVNQNIDQKRADKKQILKKRTRMSHDNSAWLGVDIKTVDADFVEENGLKVDYGVYINSVVENSPADEAGLKSGDIILKFNSVRVNSASDLIDLVGEGNPGDEVTLYIDRDGRKLKEVATLGEWDGEWENAKDRSFFSYRFTPRDRLESYELFSSTYIGVSLESVSGQLLAYFGGDDGSAALITEVQEGTPAEDAGLKAGDVIIKIDGDDIESVSDVQRAVRSADEGEEVELTILRDRRQKTISVAVKDRSKRNRYKGDRLGARRFDHPKYLMNTLSRMRGLSQGGIGNGALFFDFDDQREDMRELRRELRELRRELRELRKELDER